MSVEVAHFDGVVLMVSDVPPTKNPAVPVNETPVPAVMVEVATEPTTLVPDP